MKNDIKFTNINTKELPKSMAKIINDIQDASVSNITKNDIYITSYNKKAKPLIEVKNLKKQFISNGKTHKVLNDISFQINENENIAILGANGAGKSTTLNIILGILKANSGKVEYKYPYDKNFLEKIGIQFQDSSYPRGISTKDVLTFMIDVYKSAITEDELNALMLIFGINEFIKKSIADLSGGQKQRLNALLSIIHKPKVVFLDELSTGLDISIRNRIKGFIKAYAEEQGMTICVVSHDISEIEYLADRIVVLDAGQVIVNAYKHEILKKWGTIEKFVTKYIR